MDVGVDDVMDEDAGEPLGEAEMMPARLARTSRCPKVPGNRRVSDRPNHADSLDGQVTTSLLRSCLDTMKDTVTVETVCGFLIGLDRLINTLHRSNEAFLRAREELLGFCCEEH